MIHDRTLRHFVGLTTAIKCFGRPRLNLRVKGTLAFFFPFFFRCALRPSVLVSSRVTEATWRAAFALTGEAVWLFVHSDHFFLFSAPHTPEPEEVIRENNGTEAQNVGMILSPVYQFPFIYCSKFSLRDVAPLLIKYKLYLCARACVLVFFVSACVCARVSRPLCRRGGWVAEPIG